MTPKTRFREFRDQHHAAPQQPQPQTAATRRDRCCQPTLIVTFASQRVAQVERRHWCGNLPEHLDVPTWLAGIPRTRPSQETQR